MTERFRLSTLSRLFVMPFVLSGLCTVQSAHADQADAAWRQFLHALGEPAAIAAGAEGSLGTAVTRPVPPHSPQQIQIHKFMLGNDLFHERRLSADATTGCVTCHAGPVSGTDGRPVSFGVDRARGKVNALTTFNAHQNFRQFWDGRSVTLADQALEPIISELEMASTLEDALQMLSSDASYVTAFRAAYPDGVTINNMADAMAHFQTIHFQVSNSPFQNHLRDPDASMAEHPLSDAAQRGWRQFQSIGCSSCHNGINLGGNSYQRLGAIRNFYPEQRPATTEDAGVATRTMRADHLHMVKVPSLHNIAMTLPYFHDGSVRTLEEAVDLMARYQLARDLTEQEIDDIVEFLKSLTGRPFGLANGDLISQLARDSAAPAQIDIPATGHADAYRLSASAINTAWQDLLNELTRVDQDEVLHFDFVQFQHLELIRHARALLHIPADWPAEWRDCVVETASQLYRQVMALEWPIADFLQAVALKGVWQAHLHNPASAAPPASDIEREIVVQQTETERALAQLESSEIVSDAGKLLNCTL